MSNRLSTIVWTALFVFATIATSHLAKSQQSSNNSPPQPNDPQTGGPQRNLPVPPNGRQERTDPNRREAASEQPKPPQQQQQSSSEQQNERAEEGEPFNESENTEAPRLPPPRRDLATTVYNQFTELRSKIKDLEEKSAKAEAEKAAASARLMNAEKAAEVLRQNFAAAKRDIQALTEQQREAFDKVDQQNRAIQARDKALEQLQIQLQQTVRQAEGVNEAYQIGQTERLQAEKRLDSAVKENAASRSRFESTIAKLQQQFAIRMKKAVAAAVEKERSLQAERLEQGQAAMIARLEASQAELTESQTELSKARAKIGKEQDVIQNKIDELRVVLKKYQSDELKIRKLNDQIRQLEAGLTDLTEVHRNTMSKLADAQRRLTALATEKQSYTEYQTQLKRFAQTQFSEMQKHIQTAQEGLKSFFTMR